MSDMSIPERFRSTVARVPDRPFLVSATGAALERLSYEAAYRRAQGFAAHLRSIGVRPGDRIVLNCANSPDYVCAYFGTWFAGATVVPLDTHTRPAHVAHIYKDCGAQYVVTPGGLDGLDADVRQTRFQDVDWLADDNAAEMVTSDLALIIYTSGTTGTPKGVCLTHANLDYTRAAITDWAGVTEADRELTTLSLTHLFGLAHVHVYCALGGTVYISEGVRDIPRLLEIIDTERITSFPGTPAGLKIMIDRFSEPFRERARALRYIVINTAPMPVDYTRKLLDLLPDTKVYMYYGLTEASRSTYVAFRDHPDKLASVGRPSAGSEVCIGSPTHPLVNEPGEILVHGPHVARGYWGHDAGNAFENGWFRTGDLGSVDDEGFVTWLGRVRDQINVDGLKVAPTEVEDVLRQDPRVSDCAVAGVPDALTGESVVAFVVLNVAPERGLEMELRKACTAQLEGYKVPRRVVFVDDIPKTDSGKIKRYLLRDTAQAANRT